MNIPYEFTNTREFFITGRGLVIAVPMKENGFENVRNKDMWDLFMRKEVIYKGKLHQIRGIETMGMPDREVKEAGFMITPIQKEDELQNIHKKPE